MAESTEPAAPTELRKLPPRPDSVQSAPNAPKVPINWAHPMVGFANVPTDLIGKHAMCMLLWNPESGEVQQVFAESKSEYVMMNALCILANASHAVFEELQELRQNLNL